MNVVCEIFHSSSEKSHLCSARFLGAEKGVGKAPSLSIEQTSALIRLLDNNKINRGGFFQVVLQGSFKKIQKFLFSKSLLTPPHFNILEKANYLIRLLLNCQQIESDFPQ